MSRHYSRDDIVAVADDLGDGWLKAVITLSIGDTAESMLSTKWDFGGPGDVEYLIHCSGWTVRPSGGVYKRYKRV